MTVKSHSSVLRPNGDQLDLWRAGAAVQPVAGAERMPEGAVFAVPSDLARLTEIPVPPGEARHLARSLAFALEDEVVEPIDDLHFAHQSLTDDCWLVAIVARDAIAHWQQLLPAGWEGPWIPEALLLPWQPSEICILLETAGESEQLQALIRWDRGRGTRVEATLLPALLSTLESPPDTIVVYGQQQDRDLALIPESMRGRVHWRQGDFGTALLLSDATTPVIDLRQGAFSPQLPLARWWSHWRWLAAAASVALVLQGMADYVEYRQMTSENLALRQAVQARYRQVNPRGAVVDVEKQLDRQLSAFGASEAGVAFTPTLAAVTRAVASDTGLSISALNFNGVDGEMGLTLTAGDYEAIEALRRRLLDSGFKATLETSSSKNDQVTARLRVESKA